MYFSPFCKRVYICGPQQTELTRHVSLAPWVHFVIREGFIFMVAYFSNCCNTAQSCSIGSNCFGVIFCFHEHGIQSEYGGNVF
jgi:hypothetical protein